jgi:DNA polymerase-1
MDLLVLMDAPSGGDIERARLLSGEHGKWLRECISDKAGLTYEVRSVQHEPLTKKKLGKKDLIEWKAIIAEHIEKTGARVVLVIGSSCFTALTGSSGISKASGKPFEQDGVIYVPCVNPNLIYHDEKARWAVQVAVERARQCVEHQGLPQNRNLNIRVVDDEESRQAFLKDLSGEVSYDIETNSLYPWQKKNVKGEDEPAAIKALGFGTKNAQWVILTPEHPDSTLTPEAFDQLLEDIDHALRQNEVQLIAHNGKFDFLWTWVHYGLNWLEHFYFDTMLAHYLLDENDKHGLKHVAQLLCGAPDWDVDKDTKQAKGKLSHFLRYLGHDLFYTRELKPILEKMFKKEPRVRRVFDLILMPCARLFTEVEYDGIFIDMTKFDEAENFLLGELKHHEEKLKKWGDIEWGSPQQLSRLLYGKKADGGLGIKCPLKTPKGSNSTSESALNMIDHPCVSDLIAYRGAKQQLSFFIEGWKPFLDVKRIKNRELTFLHPSFKLHGTVTGRLSCEHPNLQQVPRDKRIRSLITAPPGWTLIECDLSQIELRIAASLARERNMIHAFMTGVDIHWLTAIREIERGGGLKDLVIDTARTWSQTKSIDYAEAIDTLLRMGPDNAAEINPEWKEYRKKAKAINFGYLYGMWWKKFKVYARDNYGVEITDEQAEASREFYFETYSGLVEWHKRQCRLVRRDGFVETLSGRRRRLPDAMSEKDSPARGAAERQAINSPVQSLANELNLMAALQLRQEFSRDVVRISATIHDAILAIVRDDMVEQVFTRLLKIMQRPKLMDTLEIELAVPIEAEGKIGPWGIGVSLEKWRKARAEVHSC